MRRGLVLLLLVFVLTGCHGQWGGGSGWSGGSSSSAESNVRSAIPAIEAYYADHDSYEGATLETLRSLYDAALPEVVVVEATVKTYCVESTVGSESYFKAGPGADIWAGHCGDPVPEPPPPPAPAPPETFTDAEAAILDVIPAIEAFRADSGTYAGLNSDTTIYGVSLSQVRITVLNGGKAYCVEAPRRAPSAHFVGPPGPIGPGPC